jgi:hypothetical protein
MSFFDQYESLIQQAEEMRKMSCFNVPVLLNQSTPPQKSIQPPRDPLRLQPAGVVDTFKELNALGMDEQKLCANYRCDLIWRRMVRMFRRFMKKTALSPEQYKGIHSEPFSEQGLLFARALDVAPELAS